MEKIIRVEEIILNINRDKEDLVSEIASILLTPKNNIKEFNIVKKAIDSRNKTNIKFVYSADVVVNNSDEILNWDKNHRVRIKEPFEYSIKLVKNDNRPVIVGFGPAGMFVSLALSIAGLKPIIIERGDQIEKRVEVVDDFIKKSILNPESNIQFGEGGAGTFSDGKLYTLINDPRSSFIFNKLVEAGAPRDILTNANPHIGTDNLRKVVKNIRQEIIKLGGEIRFNTKLTNLVVENEKLVSAVLNNNEHIKTDNLILAIGHSARDTYQMIYDNKLEITPKAFSIGVRIEHLQKNINIAQYGNLENISILGPAKYKLVQHADNARSVYAFCMCPGGYVVGATSETGSVVTNGMSLYAQDNINSNSALLVPVSPSDFKSDHPLAGIEFQRYWEKKAFLLGGSNYKAPAQLVGDFLNDKASNKLGEVKPSYLPGIKLCSLDNCLPDYVINSLKKAIPLMNNKIKGFAHPEAVLTAIETRSSAPLRVIRDANYQSNIKGIYPCGEGAGYAGGIVSSAIDGLSVAEAIIKKYETN